MNLHNKKLKTNSQKLRKNMTKEEKHLWYDFLKSLPVTFHRQKVIDRFIVDFYCASAMLIIELDGSQHYSDEISAADAERDLFLSELGYTVMIFSNLDIKKNFKGICQEIYNKLGL